MKVSAFALSLCLDLGAVAFEEGFELFDAGQGGEVAGNAVQSLRGQCCENPFARRRSDSDARRCLGGFGGLSDFLRGQ